MSQAFAAALGQSRIMEENAYSRRRGEAERATPANNVTLRCGRPLQYGPAVFQMVRHNESLTTWVFSALRAGCADNTMRNPFVNFAPKAGDPRPAFLVPAAGTGPPAVTYTSDGASYDFSALSAHSSPPRNQEADAIMAIVCHAILKPPTTVNSVGHLTNRLNALNGRSNSTLRTGTISGTNALTLDIISRIHRAFAEDPMARKAVCNIIFNAIMLPTTPMEEAIMSQNQLLMGSGVASALRAANFAMAFPEVIDMVPSLKRETASLVRMLMARATEDPLTIAFGGQMYRDGYRTVRVGEISSLVTVAILLERKANPSAAQIVVPLKAGDALTACEKLADAIAARAKSQMDEFAKAAATVTI